MSAANASGNGARHKIRIRDVTIEYPGSALGRESLLPGEPLTIRVAFDASEATDDVQMGIAIHDEDGRHVFGTNTRMAGAPTSVSAGRGEAVFAFRQVPLLGGTYRITLGVQSTNEGTVYDWREQRYEFSVSNPTGTVGRVAFPLTVRFSGPVLA